MGYLTELVAPDDLDARVAELCQVISELAPEAVKLTKQAIDDLAGVGPNLERIQANHVATTRSDEHNEAMKALTEGRSPRFGKS